jgi:DNA-binding SARP family transcriptional activator
VIEIRLLGGFSIRRPDGERACRARLVRTLIGMLVIHRGSFVPSDVLIEALWPVRPPQTRSPT